LYDQGIIDDTFGFEVNLDRGFYFADFSGDSEEPDVGCSSLNQDE